MSLFGVLVGFGVVFVVVLRALSISCLSVCSP